MYGISTQTPFDVLVRQENSGEVRLVIKFECREGMGVLGIRKTDRVDPAPAAVYQEGDVDPDSLRAGRFVHVLGSGQRQSYALSRLTPEIATRLPTDAWVELKPHSEYGFRYLIVPEDDLQPEGNVAAVAAVTAAKPKPVALPPSATPAPGPAPTAPVKAPETSSVPSQVPMAPSLATSALGSLTKDAAVGHLREEMAKVATLQAEVTRLSNELGKSQQREKDLLDLLSRWRDQ